MNDMINELDLELDLEIPAEIAGRRRRKSPPGPIVGDARIVIDADGVAYRYFAVRRWMNSEPMILWVLYNPWMGDGREDDRALLRISELSWRWGFGGVLAVSLYPVQMRSVPEAMAWRETARGTPAWDHFERAAALAGELADRHRCVTRVAAWGRLDHDARDDLDEWLRRFESRAPRLCLGIMLTTGDPLQPVGRGAAKAEQGDVLQAFTYPLPQATEDRQARLKRRAARIRRLLPKSRAKPKKAKKRKKIGIRVKPPSDSTPAAPA